ncbi:MAG: hypothetical protein HC897_17705 [Thermoanaerobaculia bacterium]|nr:hypothetical protein [Thermoanaerobaculia bacterium]
MLMKMRSPSRMVGFIEPVGTSFQSATAERNENITAPMSNKGRNHSRQSSSPRLSRGGMAAGCAAAAASGDQVKQIVDLQTSVTSFIGTGARQAYTDMVGYCGAMISLLQDNAQTKVKAAEFNCDTSGFAPTVTRLAELDDALQDYRKTCTVQSVMTTARDAQTATPAVVKTAQADALAATSSATW